MCTGCLLAGESCIHTAAYEAGVKKMRFEKTVMGIMKEGGGKMDISLVQSEAVNFRWKTISFIHLKNILYADHMKLWARLCILGCTELGQICVLPSETLHSVELRQFQ